MNTNTRYPNQKNVLNNLTPQQMQQLQQMSGPQRNQFLQFFQQNNQARVPYAPNNPQMHVANAPNVGSNMSSLRQQLQNNQALQPNVAYSPNGNAQNANYNANFYQPITGNNLQGVGLNPSPMSHLSHQQTQMSPAMMGSNIMASPSPNPNIGPSPHSNQHHLMSSLMSPAKLHTPSPKPNTPLPHQNAPGMPNASYFYQGKNVNQSQFNHMAPDNSPGVNANISAMSDDNVYNEKLRHLSKYVEPLRKLISKIEKEDDQKKEIVKLKALLDILSNTGPSAKKVPIETLLKCEHVLARQFEPKDKIVNMVQEDAQSAKQGPGSAQAYQALTPLNSGSDLQGTNKPGLGQFINASHTSAAGNIYLPPPSVTFAQNVPSVNLMSESSISRGLPNPLSAEGPFRNVTVGKDLAGSAGLGSSTNQSARFFHSLSASIKDPHILKALEGFQGPVTNFLDGLANMRKVGLNGSGQRVFGPAFRLWADDDPLCKNASANCCDAENRYFETFKLRDAGMTDDNKDFFKDIHEVNFLMHEKQGINQYLASEMANIEDAGDYRIKIDTDPACLDYSPSHITLSCFLSLKTNPALPPLKLSVPEKYPLAEIQILPTFSDFPPCYEKLFSSFNYRSGSIHPYKTLEAILKLWVSCVQEVINHRPEDMYCLI